MKSTHGGQKQQKRTATFFEFTNMETGILLCTDVVQRGLDFPDVDWIIQYDPPHSKIFFFFILILKKILRNIFIELEERQEELREKERLC